jgi:hypothetical protein
VGCQKVLSRPSAAEGKNKNFIKKGGKRFFFFFIVQEVFFYETTFASEIVGANSNRFP